MGLLDQEVPQVELTTEIKKQRTKARVLKLSKQLYQQIKQQHVQIWIAIWQNPQGLTPQEVLDEFGTSAAELFMFSSAIQTLCADCPDYEILTTPYEYTINPDGTVTIGALRTSS